MFWITTVALAAFSVNSCNGAVTSPITNFCNAAGSKKITVCSALGFNGADGNTVFETVFSEGFGDQVVIARDELDIEVGSSDIAVAMVKTVELSGDLNGLIVTIQNIIEEAMYRGRPKKLIVILTGREENESDKRRILHLAEDVWAMLPKGQSETKTLGDYLTITVHGLVVKDEAAVSGVAASVRAAVEGETEAGAQLSGSQLASMITGKAGAAKNVRSVSTAESRAVAECSMIAEDFLQNLRSRLTGGSALTTSILPASVIAAAVSQSLSENHSKFAKEFALHANSDALRAASYRAHAGLSAILQPLYRKSASSLKINSLRAFDTLILRVAPNSRLVAGLKSQAAAIMDNFKLKTSELRREFSVMSLGVIKLDFPSVEMQEDLEPELESEPEPEPEVESEKEPVTVAEPEVENLESETQVPSEDGEKVEGDLEGADEVEKEVASASEPEPESAPEPVSEPVSVAEPVTAKVVGKKVKVPSVISPPTRNILNGPWVSGAKMGSDSWGLGSEIRALRNSLAESCAERERFLFLSGAYNPYIRDMPIPPTKLSFNYLLDPVGLNYGRQYNKLYDEQADGLAETRASPLLVPGLASIPFDPNDHPVPRDNTPWWRVIVDFYKGDSEE